MSSYHVPVLLKEIIEYLKPEKDKKYIDCTIGGGGHSFEILKRDAFVLGIDQDPAALEESKKVLSEFIDSGRAVLQRGNFANLGEIAAQNNFVKVSGILFDLGVSSRQFDEKERGFSFNAPSPLDMRMDPDLKVTAKDLINGLTQKELYELFTKLSEEHSAWAIARAVVRARGIKPVETGQELSDIVLSVKKRGKREKIHPATQVFQALRIAVNDELNSLKVALPQAVELLESGGRLIVISFHSLEDRIVKNFFKDEEARGNLKILTNKPVAPEEEEIKTNPRSRSAKLRIAEKISARG